MSTLLPWPKWIPTKEDDDQLAYMTQQFYAARARLRACKRYLTHADGHACFFGAEVCTCGLDELRADLLS
jgi:hypothetical protein